MVMKGMNRLGVRARLLRKLFFLVAALINFVCKRDNVDRSPLSHRAIQNDMQLVAERKR
jgi:hypothetical protein